MSCDKFRLGYWVNAKKNGVLEAGGVKKAFRRRPIDLIEIDLDSDLEIQGPFHGILHKASDLAALAQLGDVKAEKKFRRLEDYALAHPEVVWINPVSNSRQLTNRFETLTLLCDALAVLGGSIFVPEFVKLEDPDFGSASLKQLKFPLTGKH